MRHGALPRPPPFGALPVPELAADEWEGAHEQLGALLPLAIGDTRRRRQARSRDQAALFAATRCVVRQLEAGRPERAAKKCVASQLPGLGQLDTAQLVDVMEAILGG